MKQGSNTRGRPRGRVGGGGGKRTPNRNQTFDSNGPSVRLRGNALQLVEKYTALARDAGSQGDRVLSENYLQHADHYHRVYVALTGQADNPRVGQLASNRAAMADRAQTDDLIGDGEVETETVASGERERPMGRSAARRGSSQDQGGQQDTEEAREATAGEDGGTGGDSGEGGDSQPAAAPSGRGRAPRRSGRGSSRASTRQPAAASGEGDDEAKVEAAPEDSGNGTGGETADEGEAAEAPTRTRRIRRNPRRSSTARANGAAETAETSQTTAEPSVV